MLSVDMLSPPMSMPEPTSAPHVNPSFVVLASVLAPAVRIERNVMSDNKTLFM